MNLESSCFDFILPDLIMQLNIIEDCIDKAFDVRVLVSQQLKYDLNHLSLVQNDFSCWLEEKKLEESL